MKMISYVLILIIIRFCFSCEDLNKITFLPPFNDIQSIQSTKGEDIILICCHPDGADNLSWEDNNNRIISYTNFGGIFKLKDEKNRLILRIENIDINYPKLYSCKNQKRGLSKSISISVKTKAIPPGFEKIEKYFAKNSFVKLICPLKERQTFISWVYTEGGKNINRNKPGLGNGYEISEDRLKFIVKSNVNTEPIKAVWCKYQEVNQNGDVLSGFYEFTWLMYDPIDIKIISETKTPIFEGQEVKLICYYNVFAAQVSNFPYDMMQESFKIKNEKGKIILIIPKVTKDLEGTYECKVTNFFSNVPLKYVQESAKFNLVVMVPPKIIKNKPNILVDIGTNAQLQCIIISVPLKSDDVVFERLMPNNTWRTLIGEMDRYKIDLLFQKSEKFALILTIHDVRWEDRGKYRCSASNSAGKDSMVLLLKVKRFPILFTKAVAVVMAMKPVIIDCSIFGYPISNTSDNLSLKVVNETSNVNIKFLFQRFAEMEGLNNFYEVSIQKKLVEGSTYILECLHNNNREQLQKKLLIELRVASKPHIPNVSVLCTGSSGIVLKYEVPKLTNNSKDVTKNEIFYAPTSEFDILIKKPSQIIPINYENKPKYLIHVLTDLFPSTNYSIKWESYNKYQISSFSNVFARTRKLSPPKQPTLLEFSTKLNMINVNVKWFDECPYQGVNSGIKDIVVKMKSLNSVNGKVIQTWVWIETNITVDIDKSNLQFLISLEKPQIDYEIEIVLRSAQGSSDFIKQVYKADVVLAGSLFSCFPRCSGYYLSCCQTELKLSLVVFIIWSIFR